MCARCLAGGDYIRDVTEYRTRNPSIPTVSSTPQRLLDIFLNIYVELYIQRLWNYIHFTASLQVDKLEQSESVRTEEEEKAVEQPIVFCMLIKTLLGSILFAHVKYLWDCNFVQSLRLCWKPATLGVGGGCRFCSVLTLSFIGFANDPPQSQLDSNLA